MPEPKHTPNHITPQERLKCFFFALILLVYGTIGLLNDDLYIPGKRRQGVHLHGYACEIMYVAFVLGAVNLISVIIDHYDKRNNEINYQRFAQLTRVAGWIFFFLGLVFGIFPIPN